MSCIGSSSILSSTKDYSTANLVDLPYNDQERIVAFMKTRFLRGKVYTWAGKTLLSVHTYQESHRNDDEDQDMESFDPSTNRPCIDNVVNRALFNLSHGLGKKNQSIVFSGESGSGKTYSTCLAIKCIANREQFFDDSTSGRDLENILWQIWSSVPVLSAFGNAPTVLNNNSSRFGKLLQLQYENGCVKGAFIKTYLLEKSRVACLNKKEGNFHIFRQILDTLDEESLNSLNLSKDVDYKIAPKVGLQSTYLETVRALQILNITELEAVLQVLAVILNLGNVQFTTLDDFPLVDPDTFEFLNNASETLRVAPDIFADLLCNKQFVAKPGSRRNTVYKSPCSNWEECEERRNCAIKFLYEKLFKWLVNCINAKIYNAQCTEQHLGLLDIYGFEVFDRNTFEQLCINYANERLQYYFVKNYLLEQRDELIDEGFVVDQFENFEYVDRISLLDGPLSIFGILNEECAMKRFKNDLHVTCRLGQEIRNRKHFFLNDDFDTYFSVRHFAGVVKYDAVSMVPKNKDKVPEEMLTFFKNCDFDFIPFIIADEAPNVSAGCRTLLSYFKRSLDDLLRMLDNSDVHYVKCLNPNPFKIPQFFDEEFFTQQMQNNGVFEILKLSFQNYSIKIHIEEFSRDFGDIEIMKKVLQREIHQGTLYIYMTQWGFTQLTQLTSLKVNMAARKIQRKWRQLYRKRCNAAVIIQKFYKKKLLKRSKSNTHYDSFLNVSKKSSDHLCGSFVLLSQSHPIFKTVSPEEKIFSYLKGNRVEYNFEGDCLSLILERVFNDLITKPFKRVLFCGDGILTFRKLLENPLRLHLAKYSQYLIAKPDEPKGLEDVF